MPASLLSKLINVPLTANRTEVIDVIVKLLFSLIKYIVK
jgi:hypothetical protein